MRRLIIEYESTRQLEKKFHALESKINFANSAIRKAEKIAAMLIDMRQKAIAALQSIVRDSMSCTRKLMPNGNNLLDTTQMLAFSKFEELEKLIYIDTTFRKSDFKALSLIKDLCQSELLMTATVLLRYSTIEQRRAEIKELEAYLSAHKFANGQLSNALAIFNYQQKALNKSTESDEHPCVDVSVVPFNQIVVNMRLLLLYLLHHESLSPDVINIVRETCLHCLKILDAFDKQQQHQQRRTDDEYDLLSQQPASNADPYVVRLESPTRPFDEDWLVEVSPEEHMDDEFTAECTSNKYEQASINRDSLLGELAGAISDRAVDTREREIAALARFRHVDIDEARLLYEQDENAAFVDRRRKEFERENKIVKNKSHTGRHNTRGKLSSDSNHMSELCRIVQAQKQDEEVFGDSDNE